jgi:hypothetical protein
MPSRFQSSQYYIILLLGEIYILLLLCGVNMLIRYPNLKETGVPGFGNVNNPVENRDFDGNTLDN